MLRGFSIFKFLIATLLKLQDTIVKKQVHIPSFVDSVIIKITQKIQKETTAHSSTEILEKLTSNVISTKFMKK